MQLEIGLKKPSVFRNRSFFETNNTASCFFPAQNRVGKSGRKLSKRDKSGHFGPNWSRFARQQTASNRTRCCRFGKTELRKAQVLDVDPCQPSQAMSSAVDCAVTAAASTHGLGNPVNFASAIFQTRFGKSTRFARKCHGQHLSIFKHSFPLSINARSAPTQPAGGQRKGTSSAMPATQHEHGNHLKLACQDCPNRSQFSPDCHSITHNLWRA